MSWTRQRERGGDRMLRLMGWLLPRLGWRIGHALLYPVTAYFYLSAPRQRAAARGFLRRALGRPPTRTEVFGQFFAFAAVLLDRFFLLTGRLDGYQIEVCGLPALQDRIARGQGCILLGAHLGSFDAMRALADQRAPVEVLALMHADNAPAAHRFFTALAPRHAASIVALGQPDAMLRAQECLQGGGLVGMLADRSPPAARGGDKPPAARGGEKPASAGGGDKTAAAGGTGAKTVPVRFLGEMAAFPVGPHILAGVLGAPVMLAFGLWLGPRRYRILFQPLTDRLVLDRANRPAILAEATARYAAALEAVVLAHPRNWFNFYEFWDSPECP